MSRKIIAWRCKRCVHVVEDGRCRCTTSPSPWEPIYAPKRRPLIQRIIDFVRP